MKITITLAALTMFSALPGVAQIASPSGLVPPTSDTPELKKQKREAATRLLALMRPVWTDEQIGRIMYIGWYSGAAAMCDDLEIDPAKLSLALNSLVPRDSAKTVPKKAEFLERNLLLHVGMATGWVMSGNLRDAAKLCAEGRKSKAEMPAEKHLFLTDSANTKK